MKCSTWMQSQKQQNDLCSFPSKPFSITVIQVYALTSNAEEAEWFSKDLPDLLELTPKKDVLFIIGVQFSSLIQSCPILCKPIDCSTPSFPVHHQLPELVQIYIHWICDAIQPSHPLSSHSPLAFNLSQHHDLFQWVSSSHQVANVSELQHQSFQWIFRVGFL